MWLVLSISFTCIPISVFIFTVSEYYCFQSPYLPKIMTLQCSVLSTGISRLSLLMGRHVLAVLMVKFMPVIMLILPLLVVYLGSYGIVQHRAGSQL